MLWLGTNVIVRDRGLDDDGTSHRPEKINQIDTGPIRCVLLNFSIEEDEIYRERL